MDKLHFEIINNSKIDLLKKYFLENQIPESFRYFKNRTLESINNHILTLLVSIENQYFGYGHIDFENHKYWVGICILNEYQGKGYGNLILNKIVDFTRKNTSIEELYLTVDKTNINAIKLYKKNNFQLVNEEKDYNLMKLKVL
jgi:RimJ/RimL family protein N-acetyltransferase